MILRTMDSRPHTSVLANDERRSPHWPALRRTGFLLLFALPLSSFAEEFALILRDPPLAQQMAARARVESAQRQLRGELAHRKIPIAGSVETVLNAVFVRAPRGRLAE